MHVSQDDFIRGSPERDALRSIVSNHVASFNYFVEHGLAEVIKRMASVSVQAPGTSAQSSRIRLWFSGVSMKTPVRERDGLSLARDPRVFPRECREAGSTYKAPMTANICWSVGEAGEVYHHELQLCQFPVMVSSTRCHLASASRAELINRGEEGREIGGFFILNGNERMIRLLIQQRRHYIM